MQPATRAFKLGLDIHAGAVIKRSTDKLEKGQVTMTLKRITVVKPEGVGFVLGHARSKEAVTAIRDTLLTALPGAKFGLAYCGTSGVGPLFLAGTDESLRALAQSNAERVASSNSFVLFVDEGNSTGKVSSLLNNLPEVDRIFCATTAPGEVLVIETAQGRGILGVVESAGQGPPQAATRADYKQQPR